MATRYIYISDELNAMLKAEDNASALISRLLKAHYDGEVLGNYTKAQLIEMKKLMKTLRDGNAKLKEIEIDAHRSTNK